MTGTTKVNQFLAEAQVFYLTTVAGDQPRCRPISFHMEREGTLYFGVGTFKEVYRQMQDNPRVEICACVGEKFLRYYGRAVFAQDEALQTCAFETLPMLREIYNEQTGYQLGVFSLTEATAEMRGMTGVEETVELDG